MKRPVTAAGQIARYVDYERAQAARADRYKRAFEALSSAPIRDRYLEYMGNANDEARVKFATTLSGRGRYSFGKQWRKAGMGKTLAGSGRRIINAGTDIGIGMARKYAGQGLYEGRGAYQANQLIAGTSQYPVAGSFANDETGSVTYSARQFVRVLNAPTSGGFHLITVPINPGLEMTFPWLSGIAQNFEEYQFSQLVFEIQNTLDIGGITTAGQTGSIVLACDYNVNDVAFDNIEQMMQYHGSVAGKVTDDLRMGVEMDPAKTRVENRFVRSYPNKLGTDIEEYDNGNLHIGMNNVPSALYNQQIGYLWVYYTVRLMKPKLQKLRGEDIKTFMCAATANQTQALLLGATTGADLAVAQHNSIDCAVTITSTNIKITLPTYLNGDFAATIRVEGTTFAGTWSNWIVGSGNVALILDIYCTSEGAGDAPCAQHRLSNGTHAYAEGHFRIRPASGGIDNAIDFSYSAFTAATVTSCVVELREINTTGSISATNQGIRWVTYLDPTATAVIG